MSRRWYDDDWRSFPPSKPREAKGGIKARSRRGDFGESWWARRWLLPRIERQDVLIRVAAHTLIHPIRHGARVQLPALPDDEDGLFA